MDVRRIQMLKDLREWKAGEIREDVSQNESIYLVENGWAVYADQAAIEPEAAPAEVVTPEIVEEKKDKKPTRRLRFRKTKVMRPRRAGKGYETKEA